MKRKHINGSFSVSTAETTSRPVSQLSPDSTSKKANHTLSQSHSPQDETVPIAVDLHHHITSTATAVAIAEAAVTTATGAAPSESGLRASSWERRRSLPSQPRRCNPLQFPSDSNAYRFDLSDPRGPGPRNLCTSWLVESRVQALVEHGVRRGEVAPSFHAYVFDEYLTAHYRTASSLLLEAVRRARACVKVQMYFPRCAWKVSLVPVVEAVECWRLEEDWPAVPQRIVREALAHSERVLHVWDILADELFRLVSDNPQGRRFIYLESTSVANWYLACPESSYAQRLLHRSDDYGCVKKFIEKHLDEALREAGHLVPPKISRTALQNIQSLAMKYPEHSLVGKRACIKQLMSCVLDTNQKRQEELEQALAKYGLQLRHDSTFCAAYINRTTGACLDEVVSFMRISKTLLDVGELEWHNYRMDWQSAVRDLVLEHEINWQDACDRICAQSVDSTLGCPDYLSDDQEFFLFEP